MMKNKLNTVNRKNNNLRNSLDLGDFERAKIHLNRTKEYFNTKKE